MWCHTNGVTPTSPATTACTACIARCQHPPHAPRARHLHQHTCTHTNTHRGVQNEVFALKPCIHGAVASSDHSISPSWGLVSAQRAGAAAADGVGAAPGGDAAHQDVHHPSGIEGAGVGDSEAQDVGVTPEEVGVTREDVASNDLAVIPSRHPEHGEKAGAAGAGAEGVEGERGGKSSGAFGIDYMFALADTVTGQVGGVSLSLPLFRVSVSTTMSLPHGAQRPLCLSLPSCLYHHVAFLSVSTTMSLSPALCVPMSPLCLSPAV